MKRAVIYSIDTTNLPKGSRACIEWALNQWEISTSGQVQFYEHPRTSTLMFSSGKPPDGAQAWRFPLGNDAHSIVFDPSLKWATTWWHRFTGRTPDMRRLALHEIGHALGIIEHSDDPTSIMHARPTASRIDAVSVRAIT
jgi:predicted Zn-dependent protease